MSNFRINIYLSLIVFFKSLVNPDIKEKKIEVLIKKNSEKKYFVLTSQLRVSFLILLKYLKKKFPNKNEIIFQPFNLPEMVNIAVKNKYKIKFKKLNTRTAQPDLKYLNSIINKKTVAIVITNIFTSPTSIILIKNFCKKKKILLIEDNAIYFDNFFIRNKKRKFSGSFGDYTLYSFNIMKNISSFFGGGVASNDNQFKFFAEKELLKYDNFHKLILFKQIIIFFFLKILKLNFFYYFFLKILKYSHSKKLVSILKIVYPSMKFKKINFPNYYFTRISDISKKTTISQLQNLDERKKNHLIRKNNNIFYFKLFKNLKIKQIKLFPIDNYDFQNFMDFPIVVQKKIQLNNYLLFHGIETKYIFYHDCAKIFDRKSKKEILSNSSFFSDKVIGLPNHINISQNYMKRIGRKVQEFYETNH